MNSLESKTDSREHQVLYPAKDAPVVLKSGEWTTTEKPPNPSYGSAQPVAPRKPGVNSMARCTHQGAVHN